MNDNPFEVLRLDPGATEEEIVRRAGLLRRTASAEELTVIRQAVQALTARPEERSLHALLAHPHPVHDWPALTRFEAAFRRPPDMPADGPVEAPAFDLGEFLSLLRPLLRVRLTPLPLPIEPPSTVDSAEEILRQTVEGLCQILPFEPLA